MTIVRWIIAAALALALGSARAEDACRADVERLCQGIAPGGGRLMACLRANQAQVSPGCKAHLATVERKVREVGAACGDDVRSWCADVKPGGGAVLRCLAQNRASLSPQCQEVLQGAQEKAAEFRQKCGGDAKRLCKGIAPGQGRILACLKSREADLSPACRPLFAQ